jgi:hypothetical protein
MEQLLRARIVLLLRFLVAAELIGIDHLLHALGLVALFIVVQGLVVDVSHPADGAFGGIDHLHHLGRMAVIVALRPGEIRRAHLVVHLILNCSSHQLVVIDFDRRGGRLHRGARLGWIALLRPEGLLRKCRRGEGKAKRQPAGCQHRHRRQLPPRIAL